MSDGEELSDTDSITSVKNLFFVTEYFQNCIFKNRNRKLDSYLTFAYFIYLEIEQPLPLVINDSDVHSEGCLEAQVYNLCVVTDFIL